ncbi:hypothetical protein DNTS_015031 [Danionella cerebrum]|uniref:Securin n=1 Tax=Danionella cerebrum TaxID=2873325 RepID=A0A553QFV6_9TELE|nr:hypothetical protein DNTS_015031 [Danionella translucida]TRY88823.1 hypothetical protein DNTS_015031 [Danionella translucida]
METIIFPDQDTSRLTTSVFKPRQNRLHSAADMESKIYTNQENGLTTPALKSRQNRLSSAPDQCLRTPLNGKVHLGAPLQSSRKALGAIRKVVSNKGSHEAEKTNPTETKVPVLPATEELPEIEKFFPYDPSEFETLSVPDEVCLSRFSLAGLGKQTWLPASPVKGLMFVPESPFKMPTADMEFVDEKDAFLRTIHELTEVELPPECDF